MAGIDKQNEFYTNASRFAFLASVYRPEGLPERITEAMDCLIDYFSNNIEFKVKVEEANDWFQDAGEQLEMLKRKDLLSALIKECCR